MSMVIIFILMCIFNSVVFGKPCEFDEDIVDLCQPECTSKIYCLGQDNETGKPTLLHDVQMGGIFSDSTEFVKKGSKLTEEEILKKYVEAKEKNDQHLNMSFLKKFVDENFHDETLLKINILPDFKNETKIIKRMKNPLFKNWLSHLNNLWNSLARKLPESARDSSTTLTSFIYIPNIFIAAGGRFTEMYYWDSYWIVKGLLACEMYDTARGIIENMIHLVEKLGYIPNGNRIYYKKRSQPPMLIQMAKDYYEKTKNETFIKNNLKTFEKEFEWWNENRRVEIIVKERTYHAFRYHAVSCFPRPEAYKEDFNLLKNYSPEDLEQRLRIYTGIRSGAESGWDFSSRHMREPDYCKDMETGLLNMNPQEYAYVDLNSIMHANVKILAEWKRKFGNEEEYDHLKKVKYYEKFAKKMLDFIENVLWDKTERMWFDYDLLNKKHRKYFFSSNLTPLWSQSYKKNISKIEAAIDYLRKSRIINTDLTINPILNGVPTTGIEAKDSAQQWDYSNLWAPLQSFVIRGLYDSKDKEAMKVAKNLATAFVKTAYTACYHHTRNTSSREMYEKYDTEKLGREGGGGEYAVATGFGWTNGFIFELFSMWDSFPIFPNMTAS